MTTPDLAKLEGVVFLTCAQPAPDAQIDPANIRMVSEGEPISARSFSSGLNVALGRNERGGQFGHLLFGEAGEQGYTIDIECQTTLEGAPALGDLEMHSLDGVRDITTLSFMHIGDCREQLGGKFHGGGGADQVSLGQVRRQDADLSVVPNDAGDGVVSKGGDHGKALRASRGDGTIVPGGPATSPVVNTRRRSAGGN